jgi:hypothetical protein
MSNLAKRLVEVQTLRKLVRDAEIQREHRRLGTIAAPSGSRALDSEVVDPFSRLELRGQPAGPLAPTRPGF